MNFKFDVNNTLNRLNDILKKASYMRIIFELPSKHPKVIKREVEI